MDQAEAVLTLGERGWQEMWGYVRRARRILEETASAPSEHSDLRADATTFFIVCYHLVDWIDKDKTNFIGREEILDELRLSEPMVLCRNFANTSKHSELDDGGGRDARIAEVTVLSGSAGHSTSATIKYQSGGQPKEQDLLAVANDCMAWWEGYLKKTGLLTDDPPVGGSALS
jgi:hypothetical protein